VGCEAGAGLLGLGQRQLGPSGADADQGSHVRRSMDRLAAAREGLMFRG
jgi:hypothetical protein